MYARFVALLTAALVALSIFGSCAPRPITGTAADLPGAWVVERVVTSGEKVMRGEGQTVRFERDGTVSMQSCNACNGQYEAQRDELRIEAPVACTKRACPPGAIELERLLTGESVIERDGPYLVVRDAESGQQVVLLPETVAQPDSVEASSAGG